MSLDHVSLAWAQLGAVVFLLGMILFAAYLAGIRVYDDEETRVRFTAC